MKSNIIRYKYMGLALSPLMGLAMASGGSGPAPLSAASGGGTLAFQLSPMPYAQDALEPYISSRTISFHYNKHHQTYVDNLNKLTVGGPLAGKSLEQIIKETAGKADKAAMFNNAAQVWNHTFFWQSMKQGGGGKPSGRLMDLLAKSFGDFEKFKESFVAEGLAQFGSGWVWLVQDGDALKIAKTSNADTPIAHGQNALITCDVWEHAYYLDYQNRRKDFLQAFLNNLANWEFASFRLN